MAPLTATPSSCKTVICCRVSPSQKADIVKLVQGFTNGEVTLSIGDGANDVAMIQVGGPPLPVPGSEGGRGHFRERGTPSSQQC